MLQLWEYETYDIVEQTQKGQGSVIGTLTTMQET